MAVSSSLELTGQRSGHGEVARDIVHLVRRCEELEALIESGESLPPEKRNEHAHIARELALAACGEELAGYFERSL